MNGAAEFIKALFDFQSARHKADLQNLPSYLTGKTDQLHLDDGNFAGVGMAEPAA
jgi:hypothetical protein